MSKFYLCLCNKPSLRSISNQYTHIDIENFVDFSRLIFINAFLVGGVTKCCLKKNLHHFCFWHPTSFDFYMVKLLPGTNENFLPHRLKKKMNPAGQPLDYFHNLMALFKTFGM